MVTPICYKSLPVFNGQPMLVPCSRSSYRSSAFLIRSWPLIWFSSFSLSSFKTSFTRFIDLVKFFLAAVKAFPAWRVSNSNSSSVESKVISVGCVFCFSGSVILFWICSEASEVSSKFSSEFSSEFSCEISSVTSTLSSKSECVTVEYESSAADSKLSSSGLSSPKRCLADRSSFFWIGFLFSWIYEKNLYYFLSSVFGCKKFIIIFLLLKKLMIICQFAFCRHGRSEILRQGRCYLTSS